MPNQLKKALLIFGFILLYFIGIREIRGVIHDAHYGSILPSQIGLISNQIGFDSQSSVSFTFSELSPKGGHGWTYKIPFGSFYLFAVIGLIILGASAKEHSILMLIHFFSGVVSFLFLLMGINVWVKLLMIPDLLSRYLVPLTSLGYVALIYLQKQQRV